MLHSVVTLLDDGTVGICSQEPFGAAFAGK
jgi:hypothetical protein